MKLYEGMYTTGYTKAKARKLMKRMKKGKTVKDDLYCITLPIFHDGVMEIYAYDELNKYPYTEMKRDVFVLGMAPGEKAATKLTRFIIDDLYQETKGFDLEDFLYKDEESKDMRIIVDLMEDVLDMDAELRGKK